MYTAYTIPEYTTYSEVLGVFKRLIPVPTLLEAKNKYRLDLKRLKHDVEVMSVNVVVASNRAYDCVRADPNPSA